MTTEQGQQVCILRDSAGTIYVLPWETVQAARVSAEQQADLLAAIGGGDDTAGYWFQSAFNDHFSQVGQTPGTPPPPPSSQPPSGQLTLMGGIVTVHDPARLRQV